jgi:hypothetical protein
LGGWWKAFGLRELSVAALVSASTIEFGVVLEALMRLRFAVLQDVFDNVIIVGGTECCVELLLRCLAKDALGTLC